MAFDFRGRSPDLTITFHLDSPPNPGIRENGTYELGGTGQQYRLSALTDNAAFGDGLDAENDILSFESEVDALLERAKQVIRETLLNPNRWEFPRTAYDSNGNPTGVIHAQI